MVVLVPTMLLIVAWLADVPPAPKMAESAAPGGPLGDQLPGVAHKISVPLAPLHKLVVAADAVLKKNNPNSNTAVDVRRFFWRQGLLFITRFR